MNAFDEARDPDCERCDYDTHRCHGCGEPMPHGTEVCDPCHAEYQEESIAMMEQWDNPHGYWEAGDYP